MFDEPDGVPRIVGSAHAIGESELEAHESDDVHQVLTTVPGVYVRGEDGFGLRPNIGMRGANSERSAKVTLMEDGVLLAPAPYSAPAAYNFPLTTRLVGLEVFKGPAAVRFGPNTIGGAVNVRTRPIPEWTTASVDMAAGRFGYGKAHGYVGTSHRGFGFLAEAARVQSNGFKDLDDGGDTGFERNDTMLKLGYRTPRDGDKIHIVELKGGFANESSNETYLGLTEGDFERTPYRRYAGSQLGLMQWWRTQAELTAAAIDRRGLELEGRLYRSDFRRNWRKLNGFAQGPSLPNVLNNPDGGQNAVYYSILAGEEDSTNEGQELLVGTNDRRYVSQGAIGLVRWRPQWGAIRQHLELGVRVHADSIKRDQTEREYGMVAGILVPGGEDEARTRNRASAFATAFHLHDSVTLWDRLTIAPGLRVELIRTRFENRLNDDRTQRFDVVPVPGVGVHVRATRWLEVFGGVHRGFSPVAPGQAEDVRPEFSINYEAGVRTSVAGLNGELVGFVNDYSNLTGECTFAAGCDDTMVNQQFNAGEVLVYGGEAQLGWTHRWGRAWRAEFGARYTYTGSAFRSAFVSPHPQFGEVSVGDALAYVPTHMGGGHARIGRDRWELRVRGNYNGIMRDSPGSGEPEATERIPAFFVLDVAAELRLIGPLKLYGLVNNATASRYIASRRPFGVRPGAPLTFIVGVKVGGGF